MNELLVGMGQRIASARKAKNLTQEQLAEQSGVSYQTISSAELNKKSLRAEISPGAWDSLSRLESSFRCPHRAEKSGNALLRCNPHSYWQYASESPSVTACQFFDLLLQHGKICDAVADFPHLPGLHRVSSIQIMSDLIQVAAYLSVLSGDLIQRITVEYGLDSNVHLG